MKEDLTALYFIEAGVFCLVVGFAIGWFFGERNIFRVWAREQQKHSEWLEKRLLSKGETP